MKHFTVIIGKIPEIKIIVGVTSHLAVLILIPGMDQWHAYTLNLGTSKNKKRHNSKLKTFKYTECPQ